MWVGKTGLCWAEKMDLELVVRKADWMVEGWAVSKADYLDLMMALMMVA